MDKINIYVPENVRALLERDAQMFEVVKKDGHSINKNRFLGMLITGIYNDYRSEAKDAFNKIVASLDANEISEENKARMAHNILKEVILPTAPSRKGKQLSRLSLKPTKDTENIIEQALQDLGGADSISQYFCRIFMSYSHKPLSTREQIIFKDNYDNIKRACKNNRSIIFKTIWNNETIHEVIPYKIATGPEEMFNYLLCAEFNVVTGEQEAKSYRLNRIGKINDGRSMNSIEENVKHYLELMQDAPQYMINDDEEVCVRLDESGIKSFNRIYYGRPQPYRKVKQNGYYFYYFKASKDQLFFYFRRFNGREAVIIFPAHLREKMIKFHQEAADAYL